MQDILKPYVELPEVLEEERAAGKRYLTWDEFTQICGGLGLDFPSMVKDAAIYLHAIGEVIHYGDLEEESPLRRYVIIDVKWATSAIYEVLRLPNVAENDGRFKASDLNTAWANANYSADDRELLRPLLLRNAFEVCFRLPEGGPFDYLAPGLLPEVDEAVDWKAKAKSLFFRLSYEGPVPIGVITRMIVRLHDLLDGNRHYRHGAVFQRPKSGLTALVRQYRSATGANNVVEIEVEKRGAEATGFLSFLRTEFDRIHDQFFYGLRPTDSFACCCEVCAVAVPADKHFHEYEEIKAYLEAGQNKLLCVRSKKFLDIEELLYGIYPKEDAHLAILERLDKRGVRQSAKLASLEEVVTDTNTRVRNLESAIETVQQDLDRQGENLFADRKEQRAFMNRLEEFIEALPEDKQPDQSWYDEDPKQKIKVGIDFVKLLSKLTSVELEGMSVKWERELDMSQAKLPGSWGEFKRWFLR